MDVAADIERAQGVAGSASAGVAVSEAIIDAAEVINAVTDIVDEVNGIVSDNLAEEEAQRMAAGGDGVGGGTGVGAGGVGGGLGGAGVAAGSALGTAGAGGGGLNTGVGGLDAAGSRVSAQSGPSSTAPVRKPPKIIAAHNKAEPFRNLAGATRTTAKAKIPNREQASTPLRVSAQGAGMLQRQRASAGGNGTGVAPGPGMAPGPAAGRLPSEYEDGYVYDYFGGTDYDYEPFGAVSGTYAVAVSLIFLEQISLNGGSITII